MDWPIILVLIFVTVDLFANIRVASNLRNVRRLFDEHNTKFHNPDDISCNIEMR